MSGENLISIRLITPHELGNEGTSTELKKVNHRNQLLKVEESFLIVNTLKMNILRNKIHLPYKCISLHYKRAKFLKITKGINS